MFHHLVLEVLTVENERLVFRKIYQKYSDLTGDGKVKLESGDQHDGINSPFDGGNDRNGRTSRSPSCLRERKKGDIIRPRARGGPTCRAHRVQFRIAARADHQRTQLQTGRLAGQHPTGT